MANQNLVESFPDDIDAYNRLGRAYMELGEYTQAKEAYRKAIGIDPYNSIAQKNLDRLALLGKNTKAAGAQVKKVEPTQFIKEVGKAGVVSLLSMARPQVLAKLAAGAALNLKIDGTNLVVENGLGEYVGQVDPRHGQRLIKLMEGGNRYSAAVVSATAEGSVTVMISETYQDPSQAGRLSFPPRDGSETTHWTPAGTAWCGVNSNTKSPCPAIPASPLSVGKRARNRRSSSRRRRRRKKKTRSRVRVRALFTVQVQEFSSKRFLVVQGKTRPVNIENEMRSSYLDYAMSVIVSRALPDVRDGLKPVQRRILYAMNDMGVRYNTAYKKSARIVGEVMGKYHPHGDSPIYEAMVRMAQDFSMRYMLVDGQGNFGSVDDDPPAAMRYTEARFAEIAEQMLLDIDRDTVDFQPNFDNSLKEPTVLPTRLPNLLVNGSAGIAVGMATNIPPHNLNEVCDALIFLIDNPEATVEELGRFVKGPDFPTGGIILGLEGIKSAYATGHGRIVVRARARSPTTRRATARSSSPSCPIRPTRPPWSRR